MDAFDTLAAIAADITTTTSLQDRNQRLLAALRRVIPFDAAALSRLDGDTLNPVASFGLSPAALGRRYAFSEHPRLEIICRATEPVRFPSDSALPDPFDGLLLDDLGATRRIHACLGCALRVHGDLVGALTADALDPAAFDRIDTRLLAAAAALAGAEMRTGQLIDALKRAADKQGLIAKDLMRDSLLAPGAQMIGTSPQIARLRLEIDLVAVSDLTVLITGETGVGKELVARAVHGASRRHDQPLIYVNCAALPETLAESELFGHVRGAFTGAASDRPGKFEVADNGTLFLDEIGELPISVQPKLLRALQEGEIQRVGSDKTLSVDVRLIAATNRNLAREIGEGKFRADLFHRLNVYPLAVPRLVDRRSDIPMLVGYFCDVARRKLGLGPVRPAADALDSLATYPWPGNVRELENVIFRVVLKASASVPRGEPVILTASHLRPELATPILRPDPGRTGTEPILRPDPGTPDLRTGMAGRMETAGTEETAGTDATLRDHLRSEQRRYIAKAIADHPGNLAAAARSLGMDRGNLHHLARRLGLLPAKGQ